MLRVYVAASSSEMPRAKRVLAPLHACEDIEITLDWTKEIEKQGAANRGLDADVRRAAARADLDAVACADAFLLLVSSTASRGAYTEFGAALILGTPTFVSGASYDVEGSIFHELAMRAFVGPGADDNAVSYLRGYAEDAPSFDSPWSDKLFQGHDRSVNIAVGFALTAALSTDLDEEAFLIFARRAYRRAHNKPLDDA